MFASIADISTLSVSSIYGNNTFTKTLSTSNLFASIADISSLNISTLTASNNISFISITGSTITTNTLLVHSTLNVSTISTGNIHFEILDGGLGTISEFIFSSIHMLPGVVSTATSTINSSFIINIGGIKYKIPLELA